MNLDNVTYSGGRVIFSGLNYDSETNRGVNAYGWLGKLFIDCFGEGTVEVTVNNETFYLNKASCFKLVKNVKDFDKSDEDYIAFVGDNPEAIISQVQEVFNSKKQTTALVIPVAQQTIWAQSLDPQEYQFFANLTEEERTLHQVLGSPDEEAPSLAPIADVVVALFQGRTQDIRQVPDKPNRYALELQEGHGELEAGGQTLGVTIPHLVELEYLEGKWKLLGDVKVFGLNLNETTLELKDGKICIDAGILTPAMLNEGIDIELIKNHALGASLINWDAVT